MENWNRFWKRLPGRSPWRGAFVRRTLVGLYLGHHRKRRSVGQAVRREGAAIRVSPNGGLEPLWSRDGRELFYRDNANRVMSVTVDTRTGFDFKPAVMLFQGTFLRSSQPQSYGIASDGRFLMIRPADSSPSPITVVLN